VGAPAGAIPDAPVAEFAGGASVAGVFAAVFAAVVAAVVDTVFAAVLPQPANIPNTNVNIKIIIIALFIIINPTFI
jgi:predicted lysophospholipase L1 biosynthesis ABC-type transport system permease subunit